MNIFTCQSQVTNLVNTEDVHGKNHLRKIFTFILNTHCVSRVTERQLLAKVKSYLSLYCGLIHDRQILDNIKYMHFNSQTHFLIWVVLVCLLFDLNVFSLTKTSGSDQSAFGVPELKTLQVDPLHHGTGTDLKLNRKKHASCCFVVERNHLPDLSSPAHRQPTWWWHTFNWICI